MGATYRMDITVANLDKIDDGVIKIPADFHIEEFCHDAAPGVERWRIIDGSAPEDLEGKLVKITISVEAPDFESMGTADDKVYISNYEVVPE
jgi:hypothetical protein